MKNVHPPQFVTNVYRDLRDRHLLLPAVLLAVALVAVPVLLTRHSSSAAPPPSTSPKASGSEAVPAVVTQELGVTNYKKRLDSGQSKDPFQGPSSTQHVSKKVKHASITDANIPSTSTSSTGSGSASSTDTSATTSSSSVPPSTSPPVSATGGTSTTSPSSGGSASQPTHHGQPSVQRYTYRISVKVGEPGKLASRPDVSSLALLPSKSRPVVSFLQADGRQALFNVSSDVDSVKGDGRCAPKPAHCQYIRMKPGDKASFHYAPSNKRFNLVLEDIHAVKIGHAHPG
jgi:hypothetical protein